ncbi:MAG: tetratricopeptide repeat protein [Kiritimatiellaeota bacterium]|nr:tetratricopeptide repeat protein [Kiritimatiellota bacterium]
MKVLALFMILCCAVVSASPSGSVDEMLAAYGAQNYAKARKLSLTMREKPEARLVAALCKAFDPVSGDKVTGLRALEKLHSDDTLPSPVWIQAALSYGRLAQLMRHRRKVYGGAADGVDPDKIFQSIIARSPDSRGACEARFLQLANAFGSGDSVKESKAAFQSLETFVSGFKGMRRYLVPLHLMAARQYIRIKKDYASSVKHLKAAWRLGVANPRDAEMVLYQIGRMYDLKLKDHAKAKKFYRIFLRKYPESGYAPSVRRFLKSIEARVVVGKTRGGNGERR